MARKPTSRTRKLVFEALENRKLLSTTYTWTGLGVDGGNWSNSQNWSPNSSSPGNGSESDIAALAGAASVKLNANPTWAIQRLTFSNGASRLDIAGNSVKVATLANKGGGAAESLTITNTGPANSQLQYGRLSIAAAIGDSAQLSFTHGIVAQEMPSPNGHYQDIVGRRGNGTLTVSACASLTSNPLYIGDGDGGNGSVLVTGPSTMTVVAGGVDIGDSQGSGGVGNLTVQNGATASILGKLGDISVSGASNPSTVVVKNSATLNVGGDLDLAMRAMPRS